MENHISKVQYTEITEDKVGQRIDNFIMAFFGHKLPKSLIYRWLRKGEVRVNKKRIKPTYRICENDILRLPPVFKEENPKPIAERLTMDNVSFLNEYILFEDDDLLVVNKPSGIAVHGGTGIAIGLIEQLRVLRPLVKKLELVHRLDKETSGCILIAKKYTVLTDLHGQLREHTIKKVYHALVDGKWDKKVQKIDKPLAKTTNQSGERKVRVDRVNGKESITTTRIIKYFEDETLLEARPHTGRTHQLRVHLQSEGHSIIGDDKYTLRLVNDKYKKLGFKRLFLHAYQLTFTHPNTQQRVTFTAKYDDNLNNVIKKLKSN